MKRIIWFLLVVISYAGAVQAEQIKKPYFAATKAGTWAKYEQIDKDGSKTISTYKRLADSDGRVVIEHTNVGDSGTGEAETSTTLYVLEPGFDFDGNMQSYGTAIQAMIGQYNDDEPSVTSSRVITMIRESSIDFSKSMDFKNSEKVDNFECDHYIYKSTSGGPRPMTHTGNIWLNDTIPFGVVKQSATIEDNSRVLADFNVRLVGFGSDAKGKPALLARIPEAQKTPEKKQPEKPAIESYPLEEAYKKEKVRLIFEVKEGSGGRRLFLVIKNKSKNPFFLTLPEGGMDFEAGIPVNTLSIYNDSENSINLNPGQTTPPLEVGQTGKRGAVKGRFELTMYKGEALYSGSVTIGTLE